MSISCCEPRSGWRIGAMSFPLVSSLLGCVSIDTGFGSELTPCASRIDAESANEAVLVVDSFLTEGLVRCSGVAIAPTLVVTHVGCVYRPSSIPDPQEGVNGAVRDPLTFYPALGQLTACKPGQYQAPVEDGTLSGLFGKRIDRSQMSVHAASMVDQAYEVRNIFTSGAGSRCTPGIALLELVRELDVATLPIRFDEASAVGESVVLSGNCLAGFRLGQHELETMIEEMTFDSGSPRLPPWSLLLKEAVLATDYGGAVISRETGALIAIVASGDDARCDGQDPAGTTVAVRLAPFASMLMDVANSRDIPLRSELAIDRQAESSPCD